MYRKIPIRTNGTQMIRNVIIVAMLEETVSAVRLDHRLLCIAFDIRLYNGYMRMLSITAHNRAGKKGKMITVARMRVPRKRAKKAAPRYLSAKFSMLCPA